MARRPDLDFIERIESKPLSPDEGTEIQRMIRDYETDGAIATRQRLEVEILQLPVSERANLMHWLIDRLAQPTTAASTPAASTSKVAATTEAVARGVSKSKRPRAAKARVSS